jgi:hypothetical protein
MEHRHWHCARNTKCCTRHASAVLQVNNLGVAVLVGVFLIPTFYTRHTMLQQVLSIGLGLAAAAGLRIAAHRWLRRLRE